MIAEDAREVLEYGADGEFRRFFGSRGEGPGELKYPTTLAVDATDSLWISDNRGRAVIFSQDGSSSRTIISPELVHVHGHTPSGKPYGYRLVVDDRVEASPEFFDLVEVFNRDGESLFRVGPSNLSPNSFLGRFIRPSSPPFGVALDDTTFVVPTPRGHAWLSKWTPNAVQDLTLPDSIWRALNLDGPLPDTERFRDPRPTSVISDGEDGYWLLGSIRRLSLEEEDQVVELAPAVPGETLVSYTHRSANVRNAVFDGLLVHLREDGTVIGGAVLDDFPWGFIEPNQFYSFVEDEATGLIQTRIWEFSQGCSL